MAELDPKRIKEIEAEERARAEIRAKLEAEQKPKSAQPQQSAYKGFGCGLIIWGTVLAILSLFLAAYIPPVTIAVIVFAGVAVIGIVMWLIFG